MDIAHLYQTLRQDAVTVVFLNVLLQQLGLPVPAVPTLLVAGALAMGPGHFGKILGAAIAASVLADWAWYQAGRFFGYRVLAGLCRLSINPSSCVSKTEARFIRWGLPSVIFAKFIPGFSTVAPPIAGALRMSQPAFLAAAAAGAGLWAGLALGAGWLLRDAVPGAIAQLDSHSGGVVGLLVAVLALWLAWKLYQKRRARDFSDLSLITVDELRDALAQGEPPLLLDLRGATMIAGSDPIEGAVVAEHDRLHEAVGEWPKGRLIVTICACPEDAGAVEAARRLLQQGYLSVRPLKGGYEAWMAERAGAA